MTKFLVGVTVAISFVSTVHAQDFQAYWTKFRSAIIAEDATKAAKLTNFPFKTRGTMDEDPVLEHDKKWFLKNFSSLLAIDPGLSSEPSSMRALIEATKAPALEQCTPDWCRVGDFVFERIKGKFVFTLAYWSDEI